MKMSRHLLCWICTSVLGAAVLRAADPPAPALPGEYAPLFSSQDQDGNHWKLADHIGKRIIFLYFYPKDDTTGCTAEACSLRDNVADLKQAGVDVVGVSFDDID